MLVKVLKMMVGTNLTETQLQQIVDKTILFADKDGDGKISFEEFCDVVGNTEVHKKMVVDVWSNSSETFYLRIQQRTNSILKKQTNKNYISDTLF